MNKIKTSFGEILVIVDPALPKDTIAIIDTTKLPIRYYKKKPPEKSECDKKIEKLLKLLS